MGQFRLPTDTIGGMAGFRYVRLGSGLTRAAAQPNRANLKRYPSLGSDLLAIGALCPFGGEIGACIAASSPNIYPLDIGSNGFADAAKGSCQCTSRQSRPSLPTGSLPVPPMAITFICKTIKSRINLASSPSIGRRVLTELGRSRKNGQFAARVGSIFLRCERSVSE